MCRTYRIIMNKYIFLFLFLLVAIFCNGQKLYSIVRIKGEFSGISYTKNHVKEEFRPSVPWLNVSWGIEVIYRAKKIIHKISLEQSPLDMNFRIINKFTAPPNNGVGFAYAGFATGINHFIVGYSLQKEGKKEKGFLFHSRMRFNYSGGLGFSFNRSKAYYREVYQSSEGGFQTPIIYCAYEAVHYRDGFGVFLKGTGGFDFINKKGKRKLSINLFYNQGIKDMVHFDIHYQYGYFNDPARQVDVPKLVLRNRGTTIGFNLGIPITIKK
jgi:hypothetical protein